MARTRRVAAVLLAVVATTATATPLPLALGSSTDPASADFASALTADGTFVGAPGVEGQIDAGAWRLTSNLAAGEPPRFEPIVASAPSAPDGTEYFNLGTSVGGADGAINNRVWAALVFSGSLYVGGEFTNVGGDDDIDYIARWSSLGWSAVGFNGSNAALNGHVHALAVMGGVVHAGGLFTNAGGTATADYVAKFASGTWQGLGSNVAGTDGAIPAPPNLQSSAVEALAVIGTSLYVGGRFSNVRGIAQADRVARWDGTNWSALGSNTAGTNGAINLFQHDVFALAVIGTDLIVGGAFDDAAGIANADGIARWNTTSSAWSAIGAPEQSSSFAVWALAVIGTSIYAGGPFQDAAGLPEADYLARWNGSAWSALGSNGAGNGALSSNVRGLGVQGTQLIVGGDFINVAGIATADRVARWTGSSWATLAANTAGADGALNGSVDDAAVTGGGIFLVGSFTNVAGKAQSDRVVLLVPVGFWKPMGSDANGLAPLDSDVNVFLVSGSNLYAGGQFDNAGGDPTADNVAVWNGTTWSGLGSNGGNGAVQGPVYALTMQGTNLFVGGLFNDVAGIAAADRVARWSGSAWFSLGNTSPATGGIVEAMATVGTDVYIGGNFINVAGNPDIDFVAKWNGSAWSGLGPNALGASGHVYAMAVSGTDLLLGGGFVNAGGIATADRVARWNGSALSALGSNGAGDGAIPNGNVVALEASGANVYVGGTFTDAFGNPAADRIARWNGSTWSALGSNGAGNGALNSTVSALSVVGPDVYAGGSFTDAAGEVTADYVARWSGSSWVALNPTLFGGPALNNIVMALATRGPDLFIGGRPTDVAGIFPADNAARYNPITFYRPDARIKKGSGSLVGNNTYNADGSNQARSGSTGTGNTITFTVNMQNDGNAVTKFKVLATGAATSKYRVKYFRGTTEITSAVVAGTYETASVNVGGSLAIKVKVKVLSTANLGSSVTRLVRVTSSLEPRAFDVVKLTVSRN